MSKPSQDEAFPGPLTTKQVMGTITHNQPNDEGVANDGGLSGPGHLGGDLTDANILYRVDGEGRRLGPEGTFLVHPDGSIIVDVMPQGTVVHEPPGAGRAFGPSGTILGIEMFEEAVFGPEGTVIMRERTSEVHDNGGRGRRLGREGTILIESGEGEE